MTLSVTVLGCDGTYAGPGGACSGYLLQTDATSVWLDCGPGTLGNLQRHVSLTDLDAIVVSHAHPDHCLELPVVRNAIQYVLEQPDRGLPVYGTVGTRELLATISDGAVDGPLSWRTIDERSVVEVGDITLRFSRTDHPVETLAVRADADGRTIAYTADTGDGWRLAALGEGIDVALVEATLDPDKAGSVQHLTGAQAGRQAAEAGVARLVLIHLAPGTDADARAREAAETFGGPIAVAAIDERYTP